MGGAASLPAGSQDTQRPARSVRRVGRVDMAFAIGAFAMFVIVWVGYAIALLGDRGFIDQSWEWLRSLPPPVQVIVWVVILPIAVGMWIFQSEWPTLAGVLLGMGMIAWTLVAVAGVVRALRVT